MHFNIILMIAISFVSENNMEYFRILSLFKNDNLVNFTFLFYKLYSKNILTS